MTGAPRRRREDQEERWRCPPLLAVVLLPAAVVALPLFIVGLCAVLIVGEVAEAAESYWRWHRRR